MRFFVQAASRVAQLGAAGSGCRPIHQNGSAAPPYCLVDLLRDLRSRRLQTPQVSWPKETMSKQHYSHSAMKMLMLNSLSNCTFVGPTHCMAACETDLGPPFPDAVPGGPSVGKWSIIW